MFFNADKDTLSVKVTGIDKEDKPGEFESNKLSDAQATDLRKLFIAKAGDIKGVVKAVEIKIDFAGAKQSAKVYYVSEQGKKQIKDFTL